ncbi:MAG TPA: Asp23/Gls24 family envelope stress response protein [Gaiellaceae bacterium]|jgi:uncharacterized alkaline shock family protein YloU
MTVALGGEGGSVSISDGALAQVVVRATHATDGVRIRRIRGRRRIEVTVENGRARVELELAIRYGLVVPEVVRETQSRIADALRTMCSFEIDSIDVTVGELA